MTLLVRDYVQGEGPRLFALRTETIRRVNSADYDPEQVAAWSSQAIDQAEWCEHFDRRTVLVAEVDGELAGFADLEADGHLDRFYVSADHQRMGVATALLKALLQGADEAGLARVYSEVSLTARGFFERSGFRVVEQQTVRLRGVAFINYRMEWLPAPGKPG